ncbi:MAG: gfo/Idh/MocA family oxidoreductase, partial [Bacteroidota bacterium]
MKKLRPEVQVMALRSAPDAPLVNGVRNIFSVEALVASAPDFILLSNPTALRAELLATVIPLGVPLFIEKPVLSDPHLAPALRAQIEHYQVRTYVACNLRFLPCLQFLQSELTTPPNEVNVYCGSYLPGWRPGTDWRAGYSTHPEMGGGVHLDLIHE